MVHTRPIMGHGQGRSGRVNHTSQWECARAGPRARRGAPRREKKESSGSGSVCYQVAGVEEGGGATPWYWADGPTIWVLLVPHMWRVLRRANSKVSTAFNQNIVCSSSAGMGGGGDRCLGNRSCVVGACEVPGVLGIRFGSISDPTELFE